MTEGRETRVNPANVEGWMTSPDGDYCSSCWEPYLERLRKKGINVEQYLQDVNPTAQVIKKRPSGDIPQCQDCNKFAE